VQLGPWRRKRCASTHLRAPGMPLPASEDREGSRAKHQRRRGRTHTARELLVEGMITHPIQLEVASATSLKRIHLVVRLVLLSALGAIGCSSLYWFLYLGLPALAAVRILQNGGTRYVSEDGAVISRVLGWLAAGYAYLWLLTDAFPNSDMPGPVTLRIRAQGEPTAGSALGRLVTSVPALVLLVLLSFLASAVWILCALSILLRETASVALREFLRLTLSYQFRLIAYHLSLVDRYPSLGDAAVRPESEPRPV
jgi:hypothetical protein